MLQRRNTPSAWGRPTRATGLGKICESFLPSRAASAPASCARSISSSGRSRNTAQPVYVRHEIVHNRHVVDTLKNKGARFVEELDEVPDGAVTVFSAHGVPQSVVEDARRRAACRCSTPPARWSPRCTGRASAMSPSGRTLILIGHAGHPEVEGTMGQVGAPVHLVQIGSRRRRRCRSRPTRRSPMSPRPRCRSTTRKGIIAALKRRFTDIVGPETTDICYATQNRQTGGARTVPRSPT